MGFFDRFRKKPGERPHLSKQKGSKEENVLDKVREEAPAKPRKEVQLKQATGTAFRVLIRPQLSEKATMLAHSGRYVFRVHAEANKREVRKAVEKVYDVHVTSVNIITLHGKARRYGKQSGRTSNYKKAIVTLKEGERIEGLVEAV